MLWRDFQYCGGFPYESAKLHALRAKNLPCLHAYMPTCLSSLHAHMLMRLTCLCTHVPCVLLFKHAMHANVLLSKHALNAYTLTRVNVPCKLMCSHGNIPWALRHMDCMTTWSPDCLLSFCATFPVSLSFVEAEYTAGVVWNFSKCLSSVTWIHV